MDTIIGVLGVTVLVSAGVYGSYVYRGWKAGKEEPWRFW